MSTPSPHESPTTPFHGPIPILRARNHDVSLDFYQRVLGFRKDWNLSGMASVSRGPCSLMLCDGAQGHAGTWVWIGVGDAEALHREFVERHAVIRLPPTNYPWALEFHLEDPDGHILRFGSEPREDRPFSPWVAWYEPSFPLSFSDTVTGLLRGDFSRLMPAFVARMDGGPADVRRWYAAGLFGSEPEACKEAFTCACFNGCVDVAEAMLAGGMNPDGGMATGLNAVHWAANRGQLELVRLLLRHGAPLEVRNNYGGTVLGCAVWSALHEPRAAHAAIVEALLEAGADVKESGYPSGHDGIDGILRRFGAGGSAPAA